MTRTLVDVDGGDPALVAIAVRASLDGSGPAVRVSPAGASVGGGSRVLAEVSRRISVVVETSGSTGRPKRVALGTEALLTSASATDAALGGPGQWLLCLPTHYIAGLQVLVRSIAAQSEPRVLEPGHFDPAAFSALAATLTGDRRYTSLVPVQLARLLAHAEADEHAAEVLRRFDAILVGGQATPEVLVERAKALGVRVRLSYGASETAGGCVYDGVPIGHARVRVVDGLVELGGPVIAEGYLAADFTIDAEPTAAAFVVDSGSRWYRTGDVGAVASAGDGEGVLLTVLGRSDNVIVSGGEKVSLDAIERAVHALGLEDAVVVGVPDERWGEVPVVVTEGEAPSRGPMRSALTARLGRAAAPAAIVRLVPLPRLASGKPDRPAIRRAALHSLDR